jgi:dTMP kinase
MKSKFIVLETIYGGGNSIVGMFKRLKRDFPTHGNDIVICHSEDAGRVDAMGAKSILEHNTALPPLAKAFLEISARAQICHAVIDPALAQGKLVLCKNFTLASKIGFKLNFPEVSDLMIKNEEAARGLTKPDLTIFIDWSPESCYERLNRDDLVHPDGIGFYRKMRELYIEELDKFPREEMAIICPQADNDATWLAIKPMFEDILAS